MNEDKLTIYNALYCAVRYLGFSLLYFAIVAIVFIPILIYLSPEELHNIPLDPNITIEELWTSFFSCRGLELYLVVICIFILASAYIIHVLSMNKTLMHEYKKFKFVVPFEKIKRRDAVLVLVSMFAISFLISIISEQLLLTIVLLNLFVTFIAILIPIYLYINFWKKVKVIQLEKTDDVQS